MSLILLSLLGCSDEDIKTFEKVQTSEKVQMAPLTSAPELTIRSNPGTPLNASFNSTRNYAKLRVELVKFHCLRSRRDIAGDDLKITIDGKTLWSSGDQKIHGGTVRTFLTGDTYVEVDVNSIDIDLWERGSIRDTHIAGAHRSLNEYVLDTKELYVNEDNWLLLDLKRTLSEYKVWLRIRPACAHWADEANPDQDGDGFLDKWETHGIDLNCDNNYDIPALATMVVEDEHQTNSQPNSMVKDLFVVMRWFEDDKNKPQESYADVIKAFAQAPYYAGGTDNPNKTGKTINLIIDAGNQTFTDPVTGDEVLIGTKMTNPKGGPIYGHSANSSAPRNADEFIEFVKTHELDELKGIFRFIYFGPMWDAKYGGVTIGYPNSDIMYLDRTDSVTVMHELGHSLGLGHGGGDRHNCKPNHISIMNYLYSGNPGIPWRDPSVNHGRINYFIDYAPAQIPDMSLDRNTRLSVLPWLDENSLDETEPLFAASNQTLPRVEMTYSHYDPTASEGGAGPGTCSDGLDNSDNGFIDELDPDCRSAVTTQIHLPIDWNLDGVNEEDISMNIDLFHSIGSCGIDDMIGDNSGLDVLETFDEWAMIRLKPSWGLGRGPIIISKDDIKYSLNRTNDRAQIISQITATNLSLFVNGMQSPIVAGTPLRLEFNAVNQGPNPAGGSLIRIVLPQGVDFIGVSDDLVECEITDEQDEMKILECMIGLLENNEERIFDIELLPHANSAGRTRFVSIRILHLDGRDTNSSNNFVDFQIISMPGFLNFSDSSRPWVGQYGSPDPVIIDHASTNGDYAIELPCGFATIDSPVFNSTELEMISDTLSLDVFIPIEPDNPWWLGDIGLFLEAPSANIWNQPIGNSVNLTSLPRGAWSTVSFSLSNEQVEALKGDFPSFRFRLQSNSGTCNPSVYMDNIRFTGDTFIRDLYHTPANTGFAISSTGVLTFDNATDWSSDVVLLEDYEIFTQGTGSIAFEPTNFTVLESREFSTSELADISSIINLDVYVPQLPPDPYWVGNIQLYLNCPSADMHNYFVGQESLNNRFDNAFNSVQFTSLYFDVPFVVEQVLKGDYSDCSFIFTMSVNPEWGMFRFDNGGFVQ